MLVVLTAALASLATVSHFQRGMFEANSLLWFSSDGQYTFGLRRGYLVYVRCGLYSASSGELIAPELQSTLVIWTYFDSGGGGAEPWVVWWKPRTWERVWFQYWEPDGIGAIQEENRLVFPLWPFIAALAGSCLIHYGRLLILRGRTRRWIAAGRCLGCGYDLRNLPIPRCPECGVLGEDVEPHGGRGRGRG